MNTGRIEVLSGGIAVRYAGSGQSDDGPDYQHFCNAHRWASLPVPNAVPEAQCPFCRVEFEEVRGRERYKALATDAGAQQIDAFVTTRTK